VIYANEFAAHLRASGCRESTVRRYGLYLSLFHRYLHTCRITDIREVTAEKIIQFRVYIRQLPVKRNAKKMRTYDHNSCIKTLSVVRRYFAWLVQDERILRSPFELIAGGEKRIQHLRNALSEKIIARFLDSITGNDALSIRDRCICELLYASAIRLGELVSLTLQDVDMSAHSLYLEKTKNGYARIIPVSARACAHLAAYWNSSRPFLANAKSTTFFVSKSGRPLSNSSVGKMLHKRLCEANMQDVPLTAHIFRHSCATHLLANGAGLRQVQELLGHRNIASTVGYTHFDLTHKRRLVKLYHPLENELYEDLGAKKY